MVPFWSVRRTVQPVCRQPVQNGLIWVAVAVVCPHADNGAKGPCGREQRLPGGGIGTVMPHHQIIQIRQPRRHQGVLPGHRLVSGYEYSTFSRLKQDAEALFVIRSGCQTWKNRDFAVCKGDFGSLGDENIRIRNAVGLPDGHPPRQQGRTVHMVCIRVGQNHTVDPENTDRIEILHGRIGAFLPGAAAAVHQIGPARRLQHHALALTHVQHRHPVIFVQRREPTKSNGQWPRPVRRPRRRPWVAVCAIEIPAGAARKRPATRQ